MADFDSPHVQENFTNASPMDTLKKKFPALPSNYVTLQQLQERRLKELQKVKEKEEEEKKQKQLQEEEKERAEEEERKRLLQESLQALIINASGRRSGKQGDKISAVEKEADGPDKAIEESKRRGKCYQKNRNKLKEKVTLSPVECIQAPEKSAGNGKNPRSDRPERGDGTEKSGLENGGDRTVEIAPDASGMRLDGQKVARQRRNAGKKCGNQRTGRINQSMQGKQSEKIEWKEKADQTVEHDDEMGDPGSNGGKEEGLMNSKKIERKDLEDRIVEVVHEKGDDGIVDSNLSLGKKGVWKEVDNKSRAEMKFGYRRNPGKIAARGREKIRKNDTVYRMMENAQKVENFEKKDWVDPMVEIAQKVADVVVDHHQMVELDDKISDPGSNSGKEEGLMNPNKIEREDTEDRMVEVAHDKGDDGIVDSNLTLEKKADWKEVDNKSRAEMKFGYWRNRGKIATRSQEKIRKNDTVYPMMENAQKEENFEKKDGVDPVVEIAQKVADVVVDHHQMVELYDKISDPGSNGGKEEGLMNPKKIEREDTEDRMVEAAHEKGDDDIVDSNLTLEKKGVRKEVDNKSRAEMKFGHRRNRRKIATRSQEKIRKNYTVYRMMENAQKVENFEKKDGVDSMVEIAQKVSDVVVDHHQTVEEVEGRKEADERTKAEMRRGFQKYHEKTRAPWLENKDRARKQRAGNLVWVRKGEIRSTLL